MKNYLVEAIWKLKPGAEFVITNDDYSTVEWHILKGAEPTQSEIDAAIEQIKTEEIAAATEKTNEKNALLAKLGITEDEAKLLLG